jgi:hypothetical protein
MTASGTPAITKTTSSDVTGIKLTEHILRNATSSG